MSKVLFFASDYIIGLSSLLTTQVCAFAKAGIKLHVVCGDGEQESGLHSKLKDNEIPCTIVQGLDEHNDYRKKTRILRELIQTEACDIVHVQNNWQLALVAGAKRFLGKTPKVIYTLHGFRHNHKIKSQIAKFIIGSALWLFADKVICMCNYLRQEFSFLKHKIELLPLGVDDQFFRPVNITHTHGLQIIFPAQFRKGKNQDLIIKAFADYLNKTGDEQSHLYLPGSGDLLDSMKALAHQLHLDSRITFPGQCSKEEVFKLYQNCNVAVIASNSETFGQSIVEPFVMGLIVISRPVGIAPDIIKHGETGFIFNDQVDLSELFQQLTTNIPQKLTEQSSLIAKRFQWNNIAGCYKKVCLD